ncbi:hypothetical protein [Luteimicrobium subarcticum]|uniref:Uncharacterized protein n=1 Tax=Luteimicrobium subarcticum TaxID=620910 RepID=A0A2M8W1M2_9MICO|nr:hypothetical protein [Luteimicrobium subarcticum]PJI84808.1 hypothetical protein CLV34_3053 [Luteimicrobium subarcticum]
MSQNDPLEQLRAAARPAHDHLDLDGGLARLHRTTEGTAPGAGTRRRRRTATVGALGVAGVAAVAAAGMLVSGGVPADGGAAPAAAGAGDTVTPAPVTGTSAATAGAGSPGDSAPDVPRANAAAVAYIAGAREATESKDLTGWVLTTKHTAWFKEAGEPRELSIRAEGVSTVDGRFTMSHYDDDDHTWEYHIADPGSEVDMTYSYVNKVAKTYTSFPWQVGGPEDDVDTVPSQEREHLASTTNELASTETLAAAEGVEASSPYEKTVSGKSATCIDLSGNDGRVYAGDEYVPGSDYDDILAWSETVCFDPALHLPVFKKSYEKMRSAVGGSPTEIWSTLHTSWYAPGAEADALAALPDLSGYERLPEKTYRTRYLGH